MYLVVFLTFKSNGIYKKTLLRWVAQEWGVCVWARANS